MRRGALSPRFGVPDVVIASAGVSVGTLTEYESDLADFEQVLRTNLLGMVATALRGADATARKWAPRRHCLGCRDQGPARAGATAPPKTGVISYLESLRVELHGSNCAGRDHRAWLYPPMTDVNDCRCHSDGAGCGRPAHARDDRAGRRFGVVPWQMAVVARLLAAIPRPVFDRLFSHCRTQAEGRTQAGAVVTDGKRPRTRRAPYAAKATLTMDELVPVFEQQ